MNDLCTGCGTCIALCPNNALSMVINEKKGIYIPKVNSQSCTNCGLCNRICPGYEVDFENLNRSIFGKDANDYQIGNYTSCYVGHSLEENIRYNSSSGGLITALIIFALEKGMINGAIITRMNRDKPLEPEPFIARTKEEIIEACGSKYCPVPANIALKEILSSKKGEKFAVIGLPCHIHGLRKAEEIDNELKDRIALHIGIMCSRTPNLLATRYILKKFNIKEKDVKKISYRGLGWPGGMKISSKYEQRIIPYFKYWTKVFDLCFIPNRCNLCYDGTNEFADISFGDAWLPEFIQEKIGKSIIVERTSIGREFLRDASDNKIIDLKTLEISKLKQSQKNMLKYKKEDINGRIRIFRALKRHTPLFYNKYNNNGIISAMSLLSIIFSFISNKPVMWKLLAFFDSLIDSSRDRLIQINSIIRVYRVRILLK